MEPKFLDVAYIKRSVGLKGKVEIESLTDFLSRFSSGLKVFLFPPTLDFQELVIEAVEVKAGKVFLKFKGLNRREKAEELKKHFLQVPISEAHSLSQDEYWQHQIIGLDVYTVDDEFLGKIKEILRTGSNDVYIVSPAKKQQKAKEKEILIPATKEVVKEIDLDIGKMVVKLMPGLLE